jgi:hypothetical protein
MFLRILHDVDDVKASERMDREVRFDPDLWLIELEDIADPEGFFSVSKDEL